MTTSAVDATDIFVGKVGEVGMNIGQALAIFSDIENPVFAEKEKALAIYMVLRMSTHNGVTKDKMLEVIEWLWDQRYEYVKVDGR